MAVEPLKLRWGGDEVIEDEKYLDTMVAKKGCEKRVWQKEIG